MSFARTVFRHCLKVSGLTPPWQLLQQSQSTHSSDGSIKKLCTERYPITINKRATFLSGILEIPCNIQREKPATSFTSLIPYARARTPQSVYHRKLPVACKAGYIKLFTTNYHVTTMDGKTFYINTLVCCKV